MKNKSLLKTVFYALIVIFVLLLVYFLMPIAFEVKRAYFLIIAVLGFAFLALGITLTIMARKEKGKLRVFLMLTGISAILPLAGSILHNVFYGLAITFESFSYLFEALHVAFFLISLIVAPVLFIVGVVGSVIFFNRS